MVGRPLVAVVVAALLATLTVVLFYRVGTGFLPAADEGGFVLDYLTPAGSAPERNGPPGPRHREGHLGDA